MTRPIKRRTPAGAPFFSAFAAFATIAAIAVLALVAPAEVAAHDFWIEPSDFRPAVGERLSLDLRVGHGGDAESVARNPQRQVRFVARSPAGETLDVQGVAGSTPAGYLVPDAPGVWTVGYRSNDAFSELVGERFDGYLEDEGLDWAVERRRETGRSAEPGRELYSRSIKSLVEVGTDGDHSTVSQPLGLDFEIVPVDDPFAEDTARFRVLYHGEPAVGVLVEAHVLDDTDESQRQVSDDEGHVSFRIDHSGPWILAAVVIEEIDPTGNDHAADWRSVWTSLTFERPGQ